jgi:hypothetical protein
MTKQKDVDRLDARLAELAASFESEIRRLDQVIALGEKGVNVALIAAEKAVGAALAAADKATEKAEKNTEESFAKVNEFRGALDDLSRTMATRRELESAVAQLTAVDEQSRHERQEFRSRLDVGPVGLAALAGRAEFNQGAQVGAVERTNTARANVALWVALAGVGLAAILGVLAYTHKTPTTTSPPQCFNAQHVQIACP